ncbi:uncharacterized protein LOC125522546 [Triticum urartu]|nr:uncharacterized protein LOC119334511 [Triticum dicoccoides]XP_048543552.1 uncharacterized protein LOC125522546 [Triticum urartu]
MKIKKGIVSAPPAPPAEIASHPIHPEHKLLLVTTDDVEFECDGCKERGAGGRYTCDHYGEHRGCDFDLHIGCALAPDVLETPLLFEGRAFVLLHEPPPPDPADHRVCDACGDKVLGLVYHCFDRDLDLHPSCARLPRRVDLDGLAFELCREHVPSRSCVLCTGKGRRCRRKFLSYRSEWDGEAVYLHVACVKEMAYESLKSGHGSHDGGGKTVVQANKAPSLKVALALKKAQSSTRRFKRFLKIVGFFARVVIGVIFGDPTAMIAAVVEVVFSGGGG